MDNFLWTVYVLVICSRHSKCQNQCSVHIAITVVLDITLWKVDTSHSKFPLWTLLCGQQFSVKIIAGGENVSVNFLGGVPSHILCEHY